MTELDDRIANLSPAKRRLLELRLQALGGGALQDFGIPRREGDGPAPLSYTQERFWFVHELESETPLYNNVSAARVRGPLDVQALRRAFQAVIARHEILRTLYSQDAAGHPVQSVCREWQFDLPVIDLRDLPDAEAAVQPLLVEEARKRFDLSQEISVRVKLFVLGDNDHVFCEVHHHIATDAWSSGIMRRELYALYDAFRQGRELAWAELPIQYADFAVWQRRQETTAGFTSQLDYWRDRLAGFLPPLRLPTGTPRPALRTRRGANASILLPAELMAQVQALGREEGATVFMVLATALFAVFQRHTHQDDLVAGVLTAGRNRVEVENLLGAFINVLVFRVDTHGDPSFRELLRRVRTLAIDAFANQDIPFERLVAELRPDRGPTVDPIVQVMFDFVAAPSTRLAMPGVEWQPLTVSKGTAEYEMLIAGWPEEGGQRINVRYMADVYDAATVDAFLEHVRTLLKTAVAEPDRGLSGLPLLTEEERQRITCRWNETAAPFDLERCFHQVFEDQVRRSPHAAAVRDAGSVLTYAELNARANRLARAIQQALPASEPGWTDPKARQPIIALLADRDAHFLTAMLAIFKLGGVYLPLDPRSPAARLRQIVAQSHPAAILASHPHAALAQEVVVESGPQPASLLALEHLLAAEAGDANLDASVGPRHLAYVIFTSGSTGTPKGAMIEHRGMLNHLWAKVRDLGLTEADVLAQTAPQIFDISVWQFLVALLTGGCVHIFPDEVAFDPTALPDGIDAAGVTVFESVPSMMRAMLEHALALPQPPALRRLRWLIATGEALPPQLSRDWFRAYPGLRQLNAYGPTECSDDVTHHDMASPPGEGVTAVPIGRPIANTQIYILDRHMQPTSVGVLGEIYVGGAGVGRGYLNAPRRTAESFLPDPFSPMPGARLYRTGDVARYLADGSIEFQGRADFQVKIRGMRIELGDIEAALLEQPGVQEAIVVACDTDDRDKQLAAYITCRPGSTLSASAVLRTLRQRRPAYMVPATLAVLDELPKTPTGKIDRKKLPVPRQEPQHDAQPDALPAPVTETERRVAAIWTALLGVNVADTHADFFELGGQSLLAAQLVYRLRQEFATEIPLRALFEHPTIASIAAWLDEGAPRSETAGHFAHLLILQPLGSRPPLFFLPGGGGGESEYLHVYANLLHRLGPDQPVYGFQAQTAGGAEFGFASVVQMAAAYAAEMRSVQPHGPYFLAGECIGAKVALEMARQLAVPGEAVEVLLLNAVVSGTAEQVSAPARVQRAVRSRFIQLRSLPASERLPRLKTMASHTAVALLPLSDKQRRQQAQRSARLDYMTLLRTYAPEPYEGDVTLLMTQDLIERGRAEAWRGIVRGHLTLIPLAGVHRTYLGGEVAGNAAALAQALDAAQRRAGAVERS